MVRQLRKWNALIVFFLLFSQDLIAIGFKDIKLYSYLNEPLEAEIALIGTDDLFVQDLKAQLGSPKDFVRAGMERSFFLTKLNFKVVEVDNQFLIYITSEKPVKYPFLDFLVELAWSEGRLIKGYTLLLDPKPENLNQKIRPKPLSLKATKPIREIKAQIVPKTVEKLNQPVQQISIPENTDNKAQEPEKVAEKPLQNALSKETGKQVTVTEFKGNGYGYIQESKKIIAPNKKDIIIKSNTPKNIMKEGKVITPAEDVDIFDDQNNKLNTENSGILGRLINAIKENAVLGEKPAMEGFEPQVPTKISSTPRRIESTSYQNLDDLENEMTDPPKTNINNQNLSQQSNQEEKKPISDKEKVALAQKYLSEMILSLLMVLISFYAILKIFKGRMKDKQDLTIAPVMQKAYLQEKSSTVELYNKMIDDNETFIEPDSESTLDEYQDLDEGILTDTLPTENIQEGAVDEIGNIGIPDDIELSSELTESFNLLEDESEFGKKIDLAKQYIEVGDSQSAEAILNEMMSEDTLADKTEVEALLQKIRLEP